MKNAASCILLFLSLSLNAQTFSLTGNLPASIPDNNTAVLFNIPVSGLPAQVNSTFGLSQVCFSITHPLAADLKISLTSPSGTTINLSNHNGGSGSNYPAVCLRMDAPVSLVQSSAPFQGNYVPDESLNLFNNNSNPNGNWVVSVTDEFPTGMGTLNSFALIFSANPPPDPNTALVCSTTDASGCKCKDTTLTNCDLEPDMIVSYVVIRDGWNEQPGSVDLPNSIINIGSGPVEMKPTGLCYCDTVLVSCVTTMCPNGQPPREKVNQRVYHKNPNGQMTYYDRPAGYQSYHPTHGHVHAEEFCEFSLRVATANPDATTWPVIGQSIKQGYCMINMGTCNSIDSLCISHGVVINDNMIPNLNLGTVTGCGNQGQGLFVGRYDTYSSGFGQVININNTCNGLYYLVCIIDPFNHFVEEDETNNWVAVPVMLTQQPGTPLDATFTYALNGLTAAFFNFTTGVTRTWDFGDGSQVVTAPYPQHTYNAPGTYQVKLTVFNGVCASTSVQTVIILPVGIIEQSVSTDLDVYPVPSASDVILEFNLGVSSTVQYEVLNMMGEMVTSENYGVKLAGSHKQNISGLSSGVYILRFKTGYESIQKRIVIL